MRVYLPSTLPAVADVLAKGEAGPPPLHAFAVTPALRNASSGLVLIRRFAFMFAERPGLAGSG